MNYELAKELKDAGFPNIKLGDYFEHRVGSHSDDYGGESDAPCYCNKDRFPTLEELIEACRGNLFELTSLPNRPWMAMSTDTGLEIGEGSTPTEAVARLWLALQKHAR